MAFRKSIVDSSRANRALLELHPAITSKLKTAISKSAILVDATMKSIMQSSGGGVAYEKYKPRRQHIASTSGNAPAIDTGDLINSLFWVIESNGLVAWVGTGINYGVALEFGTVNMDARPFVRPATEINRNTIQGDYNKAVREGMKLATKRANSLPSSRGKR